MPCWAGARPVAIDVSAVAVVAGRTVVFVKTTATTFVVRQVERGRAAGVMTEIARGLKPGESVVVHGAFQVKSAQQAKDLGEKE